jgi:hypothetical protein
MHTCCWGCLQGIWEDNKIFTRRLLAGEGPAPAKPKPALVATWDAAPSCRAMPTAKDSTPDSEGRLWGWNNNTKTPCAYKDPKNHVLFYVDYAPGGQGQWRCNAFCLAVKSLLPGCS